MLNGFYLSLIVILAAQMGQVSTASAGDCQFKDPASLSILQSDIAFEKADIARKEGYVRFARENLYGLVAKRILLSKGTYVTPALVVFSGVLGLAASDGETTGITSFFANVGIGGVILTETVAGVAYVYLDVEKDGVRKILSDSLKDTQRSLRENRNKLADEQARLDECKVQSAS